MKRILCVHQGTEKYGSDKSFVAAVAAISKAGDLSPKVLLPGHGPIFDLLKDASLTSVDTRYLWVLRKAGFLRAITLGMPRNLRCVARAMHDMSKYEVTYVNTAVIIDFLIASILSRRKITVHVREIPVGFAMKVIRTLLVASSARVIFNSLATRDAFDLPAKVSHTVIYNGFTVPAVFTKSPYDGARKLRLLCIGRLNGWKGQEVLVDACAQLAPEARARLSVRIVGSVYKDQVHFRDTLLSKIKTLGLGGVIEVLDFTDHPEAEYTHADIVVVPSTLPEPFGRVAIEGMAYGCAVIASNNGGLTEIVRENETGFLVTPGDAVSLAAAMNIYFQNPALAAKHGEAGRVRFAKCFTQEASDAALLAAIKQ